MAADFNAGSIEGSLELNTTPFTAGLTKAKAQAAEFEGKNITAKADLDKAEFDVKKDEANVALDKLDHKKVEAKADLDISEAVAKYEVLKKILNPGGLSGDGKGFFGASFGALKIPALISGVLGLVAALGPLGGALAGIGAAGATAFGGIAISLGLFAAAAKSAFGEIEKANKAGITLTGWAGKAQSALKGVTDGWTKLVNSAKPAIFKDMASAFGIVASILPKLTPLLRTTATGVGQILDAIHGVTQSKLFDQFLGSLQRFMGGFLKGAGPVLANLLRAFMHAFIVLQPLMAMVGHGIEQAGRAVEHFAAGKGLKDFVHFAMQAIPPTMALVGNLVHGIGNLIAGLKPLAGPALAFIGALVTAIGHLHLSPLAAGLGAAFHAITPLLGVASHLLNAVMKPLGKFLSELANGPLHQLTKGLSHELQPAFHGLSQILNALAGPLAKFAGSIANLINPTGAKVLSGLIQGLVKPVQSLAGPLGDLAVALEGVFDNGIEALLPVLPVLSGLLSGVAQALAPVIEFLAKVIALKPVSLTIFAIVAGLKAWALVQTLLNIAMDANPIGLIVIAIGALVIGIIAAYQHVKWFHDLVNNVFGWLKHFVPDALHAMANAVSWVVGFVRQHWQLLLSIITGPIGAAVIFLITHWAQIKSGFSSLMSDVGNIVSNGIHNVVSWFVGLPGQLLGLVGNFTHAGVSLMGAVFHGLESAASAVGGFAGNIAQSIWHELESVLNNILPHSLSINKGPIHLTVPLFPRLATGGVTDGPMHAMIGDNPGGREAVVPLDKYDIPRKGDVATIANRAAADNARIIGLLGTMVGLLAKGADHEALAQALGEVVGKQSDATSRRMLQMARAT